MKVILDLCGGTGGWSKPYRENGGGYEVYVITKPIYSVDCVEFYDTYVLFRAEKDCRKNIMVNYADIYGIFAAPPCTMFSRARTTAKTPRDFRSAMKTVEACLRIIWECEIRSPFTLQFWAMENPAGHLKRFLGSPAFKFHPYDFGDKHSKQTYIWGRFNEPKKKPVKLNEIELLQSKNNTRPLPPIPKDYIKDTHMKAVQIRRSITPQGFAQAFYKANS